MAGQILFNRAVRFQVIKRELTSNFTTGILLDYRKHHIVASFRKAFDVDIRGSGSISVANIDRAQTNLLISPVRAEPIFYTFEAGYGDELKIVSEGTVSKVSFRHDGPDTHIQFTVGEGHPRLENPWPSTFGPKVFPKGTTLSTILEKYRALGLPIKIDQRGNVEADLATKKLTAPVQVTDNLQTEINNLMAQYGYSASVIDGRLTVSQENSLPKSELSDTRQLRRKGHDPNLIKLNFKTGLLQASLEAIYDADFEKSYHILSFKTLWIPQLAPLSFIELNETSRYQNLQGIYRVKETNVAIDNFVNTFYITGTAVHIGSGFTKKLFGDRKLRVPEFIKRRAREIEDTIEDQRRRLSRFNIRLPISGN